jgi:hypothetical protein
VWTGGSTDLIALLVGHAVAGLVVLAGGSRLGRRGLLVGVLPMATTAWMLLQLDDGRVITERHHPRPAPHPAHRSHLTVGRAWLVVAWLPRRGAPMLRPPQPPRADDHDASIA